MNKVVIGILVLVLGAGGYWYYQQQGSGSENTSSKRAGASNVLSYVPADTILFLGNTEPADISSYLNWALPKESRQSMLEMWDNMGTEAEGKSTSTAVRFFLEFYREIILHLDDPEKFAQRFGMSVKKHDSALYMVNAMPVMRWSLENPEAFSKLITDVETKINHTAKEEKKGNIIFRRYVLIDDNTKNDLELIVAQQANHAIITFNTPLTDEEDLYPALGVNLPEQSMISSGKVQQLAKQHQFMPISFMYLDTLALVKGLTNAESNNFGTMLKALFALDEEKGANPLQSIQSPSCHKELSEMAARWPYMFGGYTKLSEKEASFKFITKMTDTAFVQSLKKLTGSIPKAFSQKKLPMYMALGINLDEVGAFVGQFKSDWASRTYECQPLVEMKQGVGGMDTMALASLGMAPGVQGIGVGLAEMGDFQATQMGDFSQISAVATLVAKDPKSLVAIAGNFIPPLQQLDLSDDGTVKPILSPMLPMPVNIAMKNSQITLFTKDAGQAFIDASEQQNTNHLFQLGMDYKFFASYYEQALNQTISAMGQTKEEMQSTIDLLKSMDYYVHFGLSVTDEGLVFDTGISKP